MFCDCSIPSGADCICAVRNVPEKDVGAGCLFFGYGSTPPDDAVCEDALPRALTGVAGIITDAVDSVMRSGCATDFSTITAHIDSALKSANWKLWDLGKKLGQGIYIGGSVFYTVQAQYLEISWGGGAAYVLENNRLVQLEQPSLNHLIRDALGGAEHWSGHFRQGVLPLYGSVFGVTGTPKDMAECERQLLAATVPGYATDTLASIFRSNLQEDAWVPAVIEIRR